MKKRILAFLCSLALSVGSIAPGHTVYAANDMGEAGQVISGVGNPETMDGQEEIDAEMAVVSEGSQTDQTGSISEEQGSQGDVLSTESVLESEKPEDAQLSDNTEDIKFPETEEEQVPTESEDFFLPEASEETQPSSAEPSEEEPDDKVEQPEIMAPQPETGSAESEETSSAGNADPGLETEISIQAENSFGSLLATEFLEEVTEQQENSGYNIFAIEIDGNAAKVSFESLENATLVVGIYDEAGEQMLASGTAEVSSDETTVIVEIETESMPQYFCVRGFLVETGTYRPLCTVYESPMYTREMQDFLAKTTADFDADRVLNLDANIANNFAVFGDEVIRIPENSGYNEVVAADETSNTYVIANADESITSLQPGDIFSYHYGENDVLIVKVASINMDGTTATILGAETSMEEVFDYVKIDAQGGSAEAVVDTSTCAEGVTYEGMVEYAEEDMFQTYADTQGSVNRAFKLNFNEEFGGIEGINVKLSGGLDMKLTFSAKVYLTLDRQYVELKLDYAAKIYASITGQAKAEIPLITVGFMFTGIIVEMTPSVVLDARANISLEGSLSGTIGFRAQVGKGMTNLTTVPKFKPSVKIEGSIFFGLSLEPRVKILSEKVASASLNGKVGAEVSASFKDPLKTEEDRKHTCTECISGEVNGKFSLTAGLKLVSKWEFDFTILEKTFKILDFYYSLDRGEFGLSTCPYYVYRVKVEVLNSMFYPIEGVTVKGATLGGDYVTDQEGKAELWLPAGNHIMVFQKEGFQPYTLVPKVTDKGQKLYAWLSKKDGQGGGSGGDDDGGDNGGSSGEDSGGSSIEEKEGVKVIDICLNGESCVALTEDRDLYRWGVYGYSPTGPNGVRESSDIPIKIMSHVKTMTSNSLITEEGDLYLWGEGDSGALGNGKNESSNVPIKIMNNVEMVSHGSGGHSAAVTEKGELYLWGWNVSGQLGNGSDLGSDIPIKIMDNVKKVDLDYGRSAAITKEGELYLWGWNSCGQLENGSDLDSYVPIKIMDNIREIVLDYGRSAAITKEGELYLWGANTYGQLGNGTTECSNMPIKVLNHVKEVVLGSRCTAAITEEGDLYMWGDNGYGQLGNGTTESSNVPVKIMSNVKKVSLGEGHSAAITEEGDLYLWGDNYWGELGIGSNKDCIIPVKVMSNIRKIILDWYTTAAITEDGDLYFWGDCIGVFFENEILDSSIPQKRIICPNDDLPDTLPGFSQIINAKVDDTEQTVETTSFVEQRGWTSNSFTGLLTNEIYNYYVLRSKTTNQPFASDNLLYIGQAVSDGSGTIDVAFTMQDAYADADIFAVPMHPMDLSGADLAVDNLTYNGKTQYVPVTVSCQGVQLAPGEDYYIEGDYGVTEAGDYTLTINGTGLYTGTITAAYKVLPAITQYQVSGTVTSYGDTKDDMTVRLLQGADQISSATAVNGRYQLNEIPSGLYTLEVSKTNHVTRRYEITISDTAVQQNVEIWLTGDVNGDGKVNAKDKKILYNHIAGRNPLTDYTFLVGDVNSDGRINAKDKKVIYNHIAGHHLLW